MKKMKGKSTRLESTNQNAPKIHFNTFPSLSQLRVFLQEATCPDEIVLGLCFLQTLM